MILHVGTSAHHRCRGAIPCAGCASLDTLGQALVHELVCLRDSLPWGRLIVLLSTDNASSPDRCSSRLTDEPNLASLITYSLGSPILMTRACRMMTMDRLLAEPNNVFEVICLSCVRICTAHSTEIITVNHQRTLRSTP